MASPPEASSPAPPHAPGIYRLRRRLRLVIALFVALVVAAGVTTVLVAVASRSAMIAAHELEVTSRRAALLASLAREQYIHEAHTVIVRDRSHVGHHDAWVEKLRGELSDLRARVDADGQARLEAIDRASRDLSRVFSAEILPAVDRQDWEAVRRAHDGAGALVDRMTEHADALAGYFEVRAQAAEEEARRAIQAGLASAVVALLLAVLLALAAGRHLWQAFSRPLASLESACLRVAAGERTARVPPVKAAELALVADAFNGMLDALASAEDKVVAQARLAAIGRVAAGVAHEINNPIAVIRGYVKTMLEDPHPPEHAEELRILDEEAAACQRIAEDLLAYARAPALAPRPVEAAEVLEEAARRSDLPPSRRAEGAGEEIAGVLRDVEPALLLVDPLRLRQVVQNLLQNAREATPPGEPVGLVGRRSGGGYRIEVLDRGEGLGEEARAHLFEPFFTTRRAGSGLGLAVCYGLVSAHGGSIRAEPREGGGSRFVVDLPAAALADEPDRAAAPPARRGQGRADVT